MNQIDEIQKIMVNYIKYTPELSGNWSRAWSETQKQRPWQSRRLLDSAYYFTTTR